MDLSHLNPGQRAAVTVADGPVLVLAGAGSGKTRVIIERMAWLVEERGLDPRHLLALTFTNRAAAEMSARFARRLALDRVPSFLGTFHSFGLHALRRDFDQIGRKKSFTIFDDGDQLSLVKRLVKDLPGGQEKVNPREALSWISDLKQKVEAPDTTKPSTDPVEESYRVLWTRYHEALEKASAVDFDDLLVLTVKLLQDCPAVRERYQKRYRYILIDEYQDTNRAQYLIARLLSEAHGNLFVVGDEDQSIYSWRGADINNILDFADDFPSAKTIRLEQNYRSTQPILHAANAVVANNVNRLGKTLFTDEKNGEPVRFFQAEDAESEARFVVEDVVARSLAPKEVAVLFRTNGQARILEEALRLRGLNYIVLGGIRFYERKEIKDILGYLRLLINPTDDESLRRIVNVPARGIGAVAMQRFEEYAVQRRQALIEVLRDTETDDTLPVRARKAAGEFVQLIDDLVLLAKESPVAPLVEALLERTDYRAFVEQSDERDFRARIEIVDEFVASCKQWDKSHGGPLLEFLQDLALVSDTDKLDPDLPAVTLMTCHSAKGLEFDHVFLVGLEEGMLPLLREFDPGEDVEEERRLCYVAMTRARKSLTLTAARSRVIYGRTQDFREVSRFVREIGKDRFEVIGAKKAAAPAAPALRPGQAGAPRATASPGPLQSNTPLRGGVPPTAHPAAAPAGVQMGTKVRHAKFGTGVVMFTQGAGDKLKARIRFDTGRFATLMISQAPIEILGSKKP
jgi:DNA helicase-2/ATP-dependent DNA helicase PcrA